MQTNRFTRALVDIQQFGETLQNVLIATAPDGTLGNVSEEYNVQTFVSELKVRGEVFYGRNELGWARNIIRENLLKSAPEATAVAMDDQEIAMSKLNGPPL